MNQNEHPLAGIKDWLAVYLGILYLSSLNICFVVVALAPNWTLPDSFGVPAGYLHDLLLISAIKLGIGLVGIWMIHTRRRETRTFFLVIIPIAAILRLLTFYISKPLVISAQHPPLLPPLAEAWLALSHQGMLALMLGTGAWWLYWWRSERVKQTFTASA